jgi:hypothetical protein
MSPLYLPHISPTSPPYLPCISLIPPLHLRRASSATHRAAAAAAARSVEELGSELETVRYRGGLGAV